MPTYEYKCEQCGTFDHWQNITEDPLAVCPTCGKPVKRLISRNVNIIFKGSGFYVTDNRSSGSGDSNGSSGNGSSGGSSGGSSNGSSSEGSSSSASSSSSE